MSFMFINLSNHPSRYWEERQMEAARCYGDVLDLPFPTVAPDADIQELQNLAHDCLQKILSVGEANSITVHIMGEMTLTFVIVKLLKEMGIRCVASTTERKTTYTADGTKVSEFSFVKFREY